MEAVICFLFSVAAFVISFFQFKEKGYLLNNAYLWASKEERERMDKSPHYRQSAICLFIIGIIFALNGFNVVYDKMFLSILCYLFIAGLFIYAVVSSLRFEMRRKK